MVLWWVFWSNDLFKSKSKPVIAILFLLFSGGCLTAMLLYFGPTNNLMDASESVRLGELTSLDGVITDRDGGETQLSEFRGKHLLLSFWASWCAPCLVELPTLQRLQNKFPEESFLVIAINVEPPEESEKFKESFWLQNKLTLKHFYDKDSNLAEKLNVEGLPANFILDPEGRLVSASYGSNDWSSDSVVSTIKSLINK
ncbi:MAG: hypothetical protein COT74_06135 [Bdellovibrionales bacterium CG10_big_fil_rev_8_21_14_0_10_45_34]|nr:MAG: hypothetical protein COT74_06135 [Bdellovibrionales bacterium CG10_big_fil_rev_8_21_14_0_10_45_34]